MARLRYTHFFRLTYGFYFFFLSVTRNVDTISTHNFLSTDNKESLKLCEHIYFPKIVFTEMKKKPTRFRCKTNIGCSLFVHY